MTKLADRKEGLMVYVNGQDQGGRLIQSKTIGKLEVSKQIKLRSAMKEFKLKYGYEPEWVLTHPSSAPQEGDWDIEVEAVINVLPYNYLMGPIPERRNI